MEMQRQRLALCGFFTQARLPHRHSPAGLQLTLFENGGWAKNRSHRVVLSHQNSSCGGDFSPGLSGLLQG